MATLYSIAADFSKFIYFSTDRSPIIATNWEEDEPNNYQGDNEICLHALAKGTWNDNNCGHKFRAVCQEGKLIYD